MTTLGLTFVILFTLGLAKGRQGLLCMVAAAVPFNDSAMIVVGNVTIPPFYVGVILFIGVSITGRLAYSGSPPLPEQKLLWVFFIYALSVTIIMPVALAGLPVVASNVGLDEQVENLSALTYSSSNLAQVAYLLLNVLFIMFTQPERRQLVRAVFIALTVGSLTAAGTIVLSRFGFTPEQIFDNSPRGNYAVADIRPRGQFSEASHLGAFALAGLLYFGALTLQGRRTRLAVPFLLLSSVCATLVVLSSSGTAYIGGGVALGLLGGVALWRFLFGHKASIKALMMSLFGFVGVVVGFPAIYATYAIVIADKQESGSYGTRGFVNQVSLDLMTQSYFLGVGLGSNRASSLFLLLLSTLGVFGTGLFLLVLLRSLRLGREPARLPIVCSLTALLSAYFISVSDFSSPLLWLLIAASYMTAPKHEAWPLSNSEQRPVESAIVRRHRLPPTAR